MNNDSIKYLLLIALLPVLQEMVFNNIDLFGFINPMIYVVFIFVFPVLKNKIWLILSAFFLGILIDMLTNDGGIHAFSLLFVAYYRLLVLRFVKGTNFTEVDSLDIRNLDAPVQAVWISIVVFIHHFLVFFLEQFSFHRFGNVLLKSFLTTILTTILISIGLQLFMKKKSNAW